MTIVFSNFNQKISKYSIFGPKYPNKAFWSQIQAFLFLHQILQLGKFEGCDFKYDNSFLKLQPKKYPNKASFVPNLGIFVFREILQLDKFKGADFKYDNIIFKILAQKFPTTAFLVKNTKLRHFWSQI